MASTIVWLRDDLRLDDNPALAAAASLPDPMTVVYILDEVSPGIRPLGGAAKWWLHHSLSALSAELEARGLRLLLRRGGAATVIRELVEQTGAGAVHWNRRYGLPERTLDAGIKEWATAEGIDATSYRANLLFEPWTVRTCPGGPYKVFTPFWRSCLAGAEPRPPADAPAHYPPPGHEASGSVPAGDDLDSWGLLPRSPDWSSGLADTWMPGEEGAHRRLEDFLDGPVEDYGTGRDVPGVEGTSRLSPHLRFGEISPFRIWHALRERPAARSSRRRNFSKRARLA